MIIQSDCNSHSAKVQVDEINGNAMCMGGVGGSGAVYVLSW